MAQRDEAAALLAAAERDRAPIDPLTSFGVTLQAGHVVLPGSCVRAIDARPGDVFRADFDGLGSVSLTIC